jgi:hypothetical protein
MANRNSIHSPFGRSPRLVRRVARIGEVLQCAASLYPERDDALRSRLKSAGTACAQLSAFASRQGGGE